MAAKQATPVQSAPPLQKRSSLSLEDLNIPPIDFDTLLLYAFIEGLKALFSWIFGSPAGSGGVFRKGAIRVNEQIHQMGLKVNELYQQVVLGRWRGFNNNVNVMQAAMDDLWAAQDRNWVKFEGRNLLGATFFGGWTNAYYQWAVQGRMNRMYAYMLERGYDRMNNTDIVFDERLRRLEEGSGDDAAIQALRERMDQLEFDFRCGIQQLSARVYAVETLASRAMSLIEKVIAGKIKLPLPEVYRLFDDVFEQIRDLEQRFAGTASRAQIQQLVKRLDIQGVKIADLTRSFNALRAQIQRYDIPGMQAEIRRIQQTLREIPEIQRDIDRINLEIDRINNLVIPQLRAQFNLQINRLDNRVDVIENKRLPAMQKRLDYCCSLIQGFLSQWPGLRQNVLDEACRRAQGCIDIPEQKPEPCFQLIQRLTDCCQNGTAVEKNAIKQFVKCALASDDEPTETPPLKQFHSIWAQYAAIATERT